MNTAVATKAATQVPAVTAPNPEDKYPKFLSTTGDVVMLALSNGHTVAVSHDKPTPLHPRFHRKAVEKGCMPESVVIASREAGVNIDGSEEDVNTEATRSEIVLRNIAQMVEQADSNPELQPQFFTGDGRPDVNVLSARCGFKVTAGERDKAWATYQNEIR